jgi:hypothetical protein
MLFARPLERACAWYESNACAAVYKQQDAIADILTSDLDPLLDTSNLSWIQAVNARRGLDGACHRNSILQVVLMQKRRRTQQNSKASNADPRVLQCLFDHLWAPATVCTEQNTDAG